MASVATAQEGQETHRGKQCCLCGRSGIHMTKFERWSEKERQYVLRYLSKPPPRNSVACKRDRVEAKRYCDTPGHIPKWKNTQDTTAPTQAVHTCIHPGCKATSEHDKIIQTSSSRYTLKEYLQLPTTPEGPCGMCRRHYQACKMFTSSSTCLISKHSTQKCLNKGVGTSTLKQLPQQNYINMNNSLPVLLFHQAGVSTFSAGNANVRSFKQLAWHIFRQVGNY